MSTSGRKKTWEHWLTHIVITLWETTPPEKALYLIRALAAERAGAGGAQEGTGTGAEHHTDLKKKRGGEGQRPKCTLEKTDL
jgi:hypothetical protein